MMTMINHEDQRIAPAVGEKLPEIALAVDIIAEHLKKGGRLFYIGAVTSGRLGVFQTTTTGKDRSSDLWLRIEEREDDVLYTGDQQRYADDQRDGQAYNQRVEEQDDATDQQQDIENQAAKIRD